MTLKAIALSIKPGGSLTQLHVGGAIRTVGDDVATVELASPIDHWDVRGGIVAKGKGSDAVHLIGEGVAPSGVTITAEHGSDVVEVPTSN